MKNKNKLGIISLLIATATMCTCFAGCAKEPSEGTESGTSAETSAEVQDKSGVFEIEAGKYNFDGATFNILMTSYGTDAIDDFDFEGATNTTMSSAVDRRNKTVEEYLGVKINTTVDFKYKNSGPAKIIASVDSDTRDWDAAFVSGYDAVPLSYGSYLYDLNSLANISTEKVWWDRGANEELSMNGILFFTNGDISYYDDMQQYCVAFNKEVFKRHSDKEGFATDIYSLVNNGGWTLDAMAAMAKAVTSDLDGNDKMDMNDAYGIVTWDDTVYGVYTSSGQKIVDIAADGSSLELTIVGNETGINALTKYFEICRTDAINYQKQGTGNTQKGCEDIFMGSNALFYLTRLQALEDLRNMDVNYGILPYPKFSDTQDRYYTTVSPYHINYVAVPNLEDCSAMSGAVLETLAYYSREIVTPAYYDSTLTGQYFRDDESAEMLTLLAESRFYDFGYCIQPADINKHMIYLFRDDDTSFASRFEGLKSAAELAVSEVNLAYANALLEWQK